MMPLPISFSSESVSVGRAMTKLSIHRDSRPVSSAYCGTARAPRSVQSSGEYTNGYEAAAAAIGKTGQTGARSSTHVRDRIDSIVVLVSNCAVATALPATSCD